MVNSGLSAAESPTACGAFSGHSGIVCGAGSAATSATRRVEANIRVLLEWKRTFFTRSESYNAGGHLTMVTRGRIGFDRAMEVHGGVSWFIGWPRKKPMTH